MEFQQRKLDDTTSTEQSIKDEELYSAGSSIEKLSADLDRLNERKAHLLIDLQQLRARIEEKDTVNGAVQKLIPHFRSLKAFERRESVLQSDHNAKCSQLEREVNELHNLIGSDCDSETLSENLDHLLAESLEKLNSARKELAAKLKLILSIKRQIDNIPTQSELVQYERRFSELNVHIQEKHRQTCKYYATYNALLEIKDLMLKETSLLNSISSQFQDAFASSDGRIKLINSMEGVVKGSQQKLQKMQVALQEQQKACEVLKKKYAAAVAEQRRCYTLLKAFQEECAKNERLQSERSV